MCNRVSRNIARNYLVAGDLLRCHGVLVERFLMFPALVQRAHILNLPIEKSKESFGITEYCPISGWPGNMAFASQAATSSSIEDGAACGRFTVDVVCSKGTDAL